MADQPTTSPTFNPHRERTSNGVVIVPGLKVRDYNRDITTVVADNDATEHKCNATRRSLRQPDFDYFPCHNGWNKPTHWFKTANGGLFDGSRLEAI